LNNNNKTQNTKHNTLRHVATHCNTRQHTATHCNITQHTLTRCNTHPFDRILVSAAKKTATRLQHPATHCNPMQPNATQYTHYSTKCNTLQHALYQYNLGTRSKTKGHALTTAHNYNRKVGVDLSRMNHNQICHERGTGATRKVMLSPLLTITIAKSASICHE